MKNDWVRLTILLSVLFLMVFPFAGLAPLTVLFFVAICGWAFQMANTIITETDVSEPE